VRAQEREREARAEEQERQHARRSSEKRSGAASTEHGARCTRSERRAHFGALASLQEDQADQACRQQHVKDHDQSS